MECNFMVFLAIAVVLLVVLIGIAYSQYKKSGKVYFVGWKAAVPVVIAAIVFWGFVFMNFDKIYTVLESLEK